jgi:hypothetical protein
VVKTGNLIGVVMDPIYQWLPVAHELSSNNGSHWNTNSCFLCKALLSLFCALLLRAELVSGYLVIAQWLKNLFVEIRLSRSWRAREDNHLLVSILFSKIQVYPSINDRKTLARSHWLYLSNRFGSQGTKQDQTYDQ